ncbi:polysaccharide deacetylase family protein [Acetobacteraceae bacterium H6797]|nr:polysaccharide deacetylase family protein [Acetobacteraceae bacterium H6797]
MRRRFVGAVAGLLALLAGPAAEAQQACRAGTVYLTIDTGWGREAEQIAAILRERHVRVTLFVADEPTFKGSSSLSEGWGDFWRARAAEGHVFASHTLRHWYFQGDPSPGKVRYASRRGEGSTVLDQQAMCAELQAPLDKLKALAPNAQTLPLWRAPGGRTTPNALRLAAACGFRHQGWSANGFLGDELSSDASPNRALLARNLANIRDGEVLLMHWGVRSRKEPFSNVLDALIGGLQEKGFCFDTLSAAGR